MWTALDAIDPHEVERYGGKAAELALALAEGLPVPPSWVLDTEALPELAGSEARAREAAAELLRSIPEADRLLLRSSSPWEDRPSSSAAGLFPTVSCAAREDAVVRALRRMASTIRDEKLREMVGVPPGEELSLAVLAQPRLELDAWCTVQGGDAEFLLVEGWRTTTRGRLPLWLQVPAKAAEASAKEIAGKGWSEILSLARAALRDRTGPWLLEIGVEGGRARLLQRRPVVQAAPPPPREEPPLADFPLFESDRDESWKLDAEHASAPLCPLLAGLFLRWIRAKGPRHPSRLIDGRWHDRVEPEDEEKGRAAGEPSAEAEARAAAHAVDHALQQWEKEHLPRLQTGLDSLRRRYDPLPAPSSWGPFTTAWLRWQEHYYDGSSHRLRRLTHRLLEALQRLGDTEPPPLPETAAERRKRDLDALARSWADHPHDDPAREQALEDFLSRHGHHAPGGWDGRAVPWSEDPTPLIAEVERRARGLPPSEPTPPRASPSKADERQSWRLVAGRALAALEDDDELLGRAYALFRAAALDLQGWLHPEAEQAEILDLLPEDVEAMIEAPGEERWRRARTRGERLLLRWEASFARRHPEWAPPAEAGERVVGFPLSPGTAEGPVRSLPSAQAEGGPRPGEVLVVPSVVPADALVFERCAALVCESGSLLGHAAVLAREHHLPAVILPRARQRLSRARRLRVDGTRGIVELLLSLLLVLGAVALPPSADGSEATAAPAGSKTAARAEAAATPSDATLRSEDATVSVSTTLQALCEGEPRVPGTEGYRHALQWVGQRMEALGCDWHLQPVRAHRWEIEALPARWTDASGRTRTLMLHALAGSGGELTGTHRLLEVGWGTPAEIVTNAVLAPGRILLAREGSPPTEARPIHRLEKVAAARRAGAAALILLGAEGEEVQGVVGWKAPSPLPVFSTAQGRPLLEALRTSAAVSLEIASAKGAGGAWIEVSSHNGIADLRPLGPGERPILVSAHLDAWSLGQGALDNAAGVAVLLETARRLAADARLRESSTRPLRFVVFTGEERGLEGSRAYLEAAQRGEEALPSLVVNLEMPEDPAGFVIHCGRSLRAPLRASLLEFRRWKLDGGVQEILDLYSDHMPFVLTGLPSFTLACHRSPGALDRIHTAADRLEELDPAGLARSAALLADALRRLADPATPLPPVLDEDALRRCFTAAGLDLQRVRERGF